MLDFVLCEVVIKLHCTSAQEQGIGDKYWVPARREALKGRWVSKQKRQIFCKAFGYRTVVRKAITEKNQIQLCDILEKATPWRQQKGQWLPGVHSCQRREEKVEHRGFLGQ